MMESLSIVFAGTPEFGLPALEAIANSPHQLLAVYSQPDRPAGRGRKLQPSAITEWARARQYPVYQPEHFKSQSTLDELASLKPDVMVVIAYGLILPSQLLDIPRYGCINVHASLLPRWRGAAPIQYALLHGDKETGVTIMRMEEGLDTGDMLTTVTCKIDATETAQSLHDKLAQLSVGPLLTTLSHLERRLSRRLAQDNEQATYAPKIKKEQAKINWQLPAAAIECQIRAYNPWPISYTMLGTEIIKIHEASIEPYSGSNPGKIIAIDKQGMLVGCLDQALRIKKLQFSGGRILTVSDWMNAGRYQAFLNQVLQ